jgi:hypothetical protein
MVEDALEGGRGMLIGAVELPGLVCKGKGTGGDVEEDWEERTNVIHI